MRFKVYFTLASLILLPRLEVASGQIMSLEPGSGEPHSCVISRVAVVQGDGVQDLIFRFAGSYFGRAGLLLEVPAGTEFSTLDPAFFWNLIENLGDEDLEHIWDPISFKSGIHADWMYPADYPEASISIMDQRILGPFQQGELDRWIGGKGLEFSEEDRQSIRSRLASGASFLAMELSHVPNIPQCYPHDHGLSEVIRLRFLSSRPKIPLQLSSSLYGIPYQTHLFVFSREPIIPSRLPDWVLPVRIFGPGSAAKVFLPAKGWRGPDPQLTQGIGKDLEGDPLYPWLCPDYTSLVVLRMAEMHPAEADTFSWSENAWEEFDPAVGLWSDSVRIRAAAAGMLGASGNEADLDTLRRFLAVWPEVDASIAAAIHAMDLAAAEERDGEILRWSGSTAWVIHRAMFGFYFHHPDQLTCPVIMTLMSTWTHLDPTLPGRPSPRVGEGAALLEIRKDLGCFPELAAWCDDLESALDQEVRDPTGEAADRFRVMKYNTDQDPRWRRLLFALVGDPDSVKSMNREFARRPMKAPGYLEWDGRILPTWAEGWMVEEPRKIIGGDLGTGLGFSPLFCSVDGLVDPLFFRGLSQSLVHGFLADEHLSTEKKFLALTLLPHLDPVEKEILKAIWRERKQGLGIQRSDMGPVHYDRMALDCLRLFAREGMTAELREAHKEFRGQDTFLEGFITMIMAATEDPGYRPEIGQYIRKVWFPASLEWGKRSFLSNRGLRSDGLPEPTFLLKIDRKDFTAYIFSYSHFVGGESFLSELLKEPDQHPLLTLKWANRLIWLAGDDTNRLSFVESTIDSLALVPGIGKELPDGMLESFKKMIAEFREHAPCRH
ncbi:MAG: hypothetical protein AB7V45_03105 [Candidatus Krumholzibacteriia bacterium]